MRIEKEITQVKLAAAIGVTQSIITRWEKDECEPTASVIAQIATYFGVSADYLLGLED